MGADAGEAATEGVLKPWRLAVKKRLSKAHKEELDAMLEKHKARAQAEREKVTQDFERQLFVPERIDEARKYAETRLLSIVRDSGS